MNAPGTLHAVDCEPSLVTWLKNGVVDATVDVVAYPTANAFLALSPRDEPGCVLCSNHPPGLAGLELLRRIQSSARTYPMIACAPRADVRAAVAFMQHGA